MDGWIKLHRKILKWEWYDDPNTFRVFIHCLLMANHEDNQWRGQTVPRGSFLTGRNLLAKQTGLSVQSVRTALEHLKLTNELTIKSTKQGTVIYINKYDDYQSREVQSTIKPTNEQPTSNQRVTTNKKDKNIKNDKNNIYTIKLFLEHREKILLKAKEKYPDKNCEKAIEDFIGYIQSRKTKYRDFKLAFFNWVREDRFNQYGQQKNFINERKVNVF